MFAVDCPCWNVLWIGVRPARTRDCSARSKPSRGAFGAREPEPGVHMCAPRTKAPPGRAVGRRQCLNFRPANV